MSAQFQKDLYLEVEEISADLADLKAIAAKMLAVQERQEVALKTIAACLEKIAGAAITGRGGRTGILTFQGH
jgi:hypothetical protein